MTDALLSAIGCADDDSPDRLLRLSSAFRGSMVLAAAVELKAFDHLSSGAADTKTFARRCGIAERGARDFFDCLVALGLLHRSAGTYALTAETQRYLVTRSSDYLGDEILGARARSYAAWQHLADALRTGKPQRPGAADVYGTLASDAALRQVFLRGMTAGSLAAARAMAAALPWSGLVVDVGAAQGAVLVELAKQHPQMTGIGLDRPENQDMFDQYVRQHRLSDRIRFLAADFLEDAFPQADGVILGRVLHNWDLPTKLFLLRKARACLKPGARIAIFERMIDDERRDPSGLLASLNMLVVTPGGFDFSPSDCIGWLEQTGFAHEQTLQLPGLMTMVVGTAR